MITYRPTYNIIYRAVRLCENYHGENTEQMSKKLQAITSDTKEFNSDKCYIILVAYVLFNICTHEIFS